MINMKDNLKIFKQKSKQILKNNKGITSFEAVVGLMIIFIIIAGIVDFSNSNVQLSNVSNVTDYISRIVSEQGGISNTRPSNYYDDIYTTSSQAFNYINNHLANNGITDWELTITTQNRDYQFSANSNIGPLAYDTPVTVKLTFKHHLKLLNGFLSLGDMNKTSTRYIKTTLHPRSSDLEIEI